MPANIRWDLIQRLKVKIVKNLGNGRLNNLNDPDRPQYVKKNAQISIFMKIHPVVTEFFHADRQTDRHDETNNRLSQFCKRP